MPAKRISMRKLRDEFRPALHARLSVRAVARSLGLLYSTAIINAVRVKLALHGHSRTT